MKKILVGICIAVMTFGVNVTSEAAQTDVDNYCCGNGYYSDSDCCDYYGDNGRSDYRGHHYGRGYGCC